MELHEEHGARSTEHASSRGFSRHVMSSRVNVIDGVQDRSETNQTSMQVEVDWEEV